MTINQANIAKFVAYARRQNWMHVKSLVLGYATCEFTFVEQRKMYMAMARTVKANPNL